MSGSLSDAEWGALRREFLQKQGMLKSSGLREIDVADYGRVLFPDGFLEAKSGEALNFDDPGGGKTNAMALIHYSLVIEPATDSDPATVKEVHHRETLHDDTLQDGLMVLVEESVRENAPVYMAPISYIGRRPLAKNARYVHAITIDLDGVGPDQLQAVLHQMATGYLPAATMIVNSGQGLHLYYCFERPIPLHLDLIPYLQKLKKYLTVRLWNDDTSRIPSSKRQMQGIFQMFRLPGSTTKLNGRHRDDKKERPYIASAWLRLREDGTPAWATLEGLESSLPQKVAGEDTRALLSWLLDTSGRTPIDEARVKWPDWYERRIVQGKAPGRYTSNERLYNWFLKRLQDGEATVHHRYFCIRALGAFGVKCGIPQKRIKKDAYGLVELMDSQSTTPDEAFTVDDVTDALAVLNDPMAHKLTREYLEQITAMDMTPSVRRRPKGHRRSQDVHMRIVSATRDTIYPDGSWRNKDGAPTKRELVRGYAALHPKESHSATARALGISRPTVIKWLKPGWREEWMQEAPPGSLMVDEDGHLLVKEVGELPTVKRALVNGSWTPLGTSGSKAVGGGWRVVKDQDERRVLLAKAKEDNSDCM